MAAVSRAPSSRTCSPFTDPTENAGCDPVASAVDGGPSWSEARAVASSKSAEPSGSAPPGTDIVAKRAVHQRNGALPRARGRSSASHERAVHASPIEKWIKFSVRVRLETTLAHIGT